MEIYLHTSSTKSHRIEGDKLLKELGITYIVNVDKSGKSSIQFIKDNSVIYIATFLSSYKEDDINESIYYNSLRFKREGFTPIREVDEITKILTFNS